MKFLAAISILVVLFNFINGLPDGAPPKACSSMTPKHGNIRPKSSQSPYRITATKRGDKISVTISSRTANFQGFMLQARYASNPNLVADGKFTPNSQAKTIDCEGGRQNTLTQTSPDSKAQITTDWKPAPGVNDAVIFRATVAKNYEEFWVKIDSSPISGGRTQRQSGSKSALYEGCFDKKGCFGFPKDCVGQENCEVFLSYADTGKDIEFTVTGSLGPSQRNYMAVGLSYDKSMGDDIVTECFMDNGRLVVENSWNKGYENRQIKRIPEGMYKSQFQEGVAKCTWNLPYVVKENEDTANELVFNLKTDNYHILIAKGEVSPEGSLRYHSTNKLASRNKVNLTAFEKIEAGGSHDAVKVHGLSHESESDSAGCKMHFDWFLLVLAIVSGIWKRL